MDSNSRSSDKPAYPEASPVVTGPVGSADLRERSSAQPPSADLDGFPTVHVEAASETAEAQSTGAESAGAANEPISQLEGMIANLTSYARPVLREITARAAELAAKAAEAAGPVAHKAAGATDEYGGRLAVKGREIASNLRRESATPPVDHDAATGTSR
jgi:hypothetical protein